VTELKNIPLPPEGENPEDGKSLLERAGNLLGGEGVPGAFRSAPVPRALAERPRKRGEERKRAHPVSPPEGPATEDMTAAAAETPAAPDQTIPPAEPVRFTGPELRIDRERLRDQGLIVPGGPVTSLLEEFRIVKRELLNAARDPDPALPPQRAQFVLICSPHPGEGKTFCATNLALAMAAEKDSEVLLVDADFAKPSVLSLLGLPRGPGLMDALADPGIAVEDCVISTDIPGLHVLPAGNQTASDSEYLGSRRTSDVLMRLVQGTPDRIVIFDSPPALAASPAAELAKFVGQAVLVTRADSTGQSALEDALQLLSHCHDIKLLLNAVNFSPSGRRFGSYYGYSGE
jgi:Mrp family chromosome partitioning ATPase